MFWTSSPVVRSWRAICRRGPAVGLAIATVVVALAAGPTAPANAAAVPVPADGLTAQSAGASCWGIKQAFPASSDGLYWVLTPRLVTPRRVYCDQTTDGGGWVLVGRGREGWAWRDAGQGLTAQIAPVPSGTGAFAVAAYSSAVVDGLLAGQPPQDLPDGIRLRRALTNDGASFQESRLFPKVEPRWTWAFGAGIPLARTTFPGSATVVTGQTTYDSYPASGDDATRVWTWPYSARARWAPGFAFGRTGPAGLDSATSFVWQSSKAERYGLPFTQVFLRPKIANDTAGSGALPDAGLPASTVRPLLRSTSEPLSGWGVVGLDAKTAPATSAKATVTSLAQIGDRIFVGGIFTGVQHGAAGTPVAQRYLAAFDRATGAWIDTFRPTFDASVWALAATPDGTLVVGGRFTTVNGVARPALVALDPLTGQLDTTWKATPTRTSGVVSVRALTAQNGWVYVGGTFGSVTGGTGTALRTVKNGNLLRVRASDGRPDTGFRPSVASAPWWLSTSAKYGDRVYLAGKFTTVNGQRVDGVAVVAATTGKAVPGVGAITTSCAARPCPNGLTPYGQAVIESKDGTAVIAAPTEHSLQKLTRSTLARQHLHLMGFPGGDIQAIAEIDGTVYSACHCFHWDYDNQVLERFTYPQPGPWERVSSINGVGAYDLASFDKLDDWEPNWKGKYDDGMWAFLVDSAGCLWAGGDVVHGSGSSWAGGFLTFCGRDVVAPAAPTGLTVTPTAGGGQRLAWTGGSDAGGALTFQVLRDDRVVAVVAARGWTDTAGTTGMRYAVRAADPTGNLSATTPVVVAR